MDESPKSGRMRRSAWLALAIAAVLASAACNGEGPNDEAAFPVGSCVIITGNPPADMGIQAVDCSTAHTHIAIAREGPGQTCPPDTVVFNLTTVEVCFRADASPHPTQ